MVAKSVRDEFAKFMFEFQSEQWVDEEAVWECFKTCIQGKTDKEQRSLLMVVSGAGDGKSRLLHELAGLLSAWWGKKKRTKALEKAEKKASFNIVELRVNFLNDLSVRADEVQKDQNGKLKADVNKIVLDRLLFRMLENPEETSFDTFRKENQWDFTCEDLVSKTQDLCEEGSKKALVMLLIDGVHILDRDREYDYESTSWGKESILRQLLTRVSDLVTTRPYRFVACTSTMWLPVEEALNDRDTLKPTHVSPPVLTKLPSPRVPASNALRSWTPVRWDTMRVLSAPRQSWLPPQLPLTRNTVNASVLRRARFAKLLV